MDDGPLKVVLVDDHQMVIDGLKAMLSRYPEDVVVAGEARSRDEALAALREADPDVVLLDVRLKGDSGLDLCGDILREQPQCRVVFLTVYDDEQYLFQALRVGAAGFLLKRVDGEELVGHLRQVREGVTVIDPTLAGRVALSAARLHRGEFWPGAHLGLTQRESEVLALLVAGRSKRSIAAELVVSEETVKSHTRSIYQKLAVSDRAQVVAVALREGLFH
ncbi:MAG: response regulator transcription factor [Actinomycetota bacterium]|nr:response regulator transcription factor [Actinomycetota bacterium]